MAITSTGACLRISTKTGTARRVTELLGIAPTRSFEIGDVLGRISPRITKHAQWELQTQIDENPLAVHLAALCDQLELVATRLDELATDGYTMDWFCFVSSGSQGSLQLDSTLLKRLAKFPIALTLDLYGGDEEGD